jgi:hypothetical protein
VKQFDARIPQNCRIVAILGTEIDHCAKAMHVRERRCAIHRKAAADGNVIGQPMKIEIVAFGHIAFFFSRTIIFFIFLCSTTVVTVVRPRYTVVRTAPNGTTKLHNCSESLP